MSVSPLISLYLCPSLCLSILSPASLFGYQSVRPVIARSACGHYIYIHIYITWVVGNIFWRGWQSGAKNVFICRVLGLCRSVWCIVECAVIQCYILHWWQAGAKNVFVCIIVVLCRSVWCSVERPDIHQYMLLPGLFINKCLAYVTGWPKSDTLTDRLTLKRLRVWNLTRTRGKLQLILLNILVQTKYTRAHTFLMNSSVRWNLDIVSPPHFRCRAHDTIPRTFLVCYLIVVLLMDEALLFWRSEIYLWLFSMLCT